MNNARYRLEASVRREALALVLLCLVPGCSRDADRPATSATASPSAADPVPAPSPVAPAPPRGPADDRALASANELSRAVAAKAPGCRVMGVSGAASLSGTAVNAGDKLNDRQVLTLGPASTLQLMHTTSTRQWSLTGPARLIACADGAEEIAIGSGSLRSEPSAGVRPGAEVWIGTPFGSLRYADGRAEIEVGPSELGVRVTSGEVWFTPLGGESRQERALSGARRVFASVPYRPSAEVALARCGSAAAGAEELATRLLSVAAEPLGKRAAEHVRARQEAHGTCASALASLLAAESPAPRASLDSQLAELFRYDRSWRGVPAAPLSAQRN